MRLLDLLVPDALAQEALPRMGSGITGFTDYVQSPLFAFDLLLVGVIVVLYKVFARWPKYERWLVGACLAAFMLYQTYVLPSIYGGSWAPPLLAMPWLVWMAVFGLFAVWLLLKTYTAWLEPPKPAASPLAATRGSKPSQPPPPAAASAVVLAAKPAHDGPTAAAAFAPASSGAGKEGVFLSYRRDDSADVTGRIYDRLVQRFGKEQIFKDVDSIPLGVDFREHLGEVVGRCSVVLVVIGDRWLSAGSPGARRLDDAADFVRIEIESALERRIPVVPVLVRGAMIPGDTELPQSLRLLAYRNGIAVRADPDFHRDMDRLITGLETHLAR